jgi:hypothetical protein
VVLRGKAIHVLEEDFRMEDIYEAGADPVLDAPTDLRSKLLVEPFIPSALQVNHVRGHPLGEIAIVLDKSRVGSYSSITLSILRIFTCLKGRRGNSYLSSLEINPRFPRVPDCERKDRRCRSCRGLVLW